MIGTAFGSKIAVCGGPACHFLRSYAAVNVTEGGNNHSSGSGAATVFTDTVRTAIEKVPPMTVMLIIIGHRAQCGIQIDIVVIIGGTSIIVSEGKSESDCLSLLSEDFQRADCSRLQHFPHFPHFPAML